MKTLNIANVKSAKQAGFTIIELIVVILLLGILSATALPRFIDVTDQAHRAAFDGVLGGFSTGMALGKAQWVANSEPTTAAAGLVGFGSGNARLTAGTAPDRGVVVGTTNNTFDANADCSEIFNAVLQGGRPAIIAATPNVPANGPLTGDVTTAIVAGTDWYGFFGGTGTTCTYVYAGQFRTTGSGTAPTFTLTANGGEIVEGTLAI